MTSERASKPATNSATKPVKVLRLRGVKVSVFENKAGDGVFYKATLQRIYREGEEWKTTSALGRDDLPVAALLLQRAFEFIHEAESALPAASDET